MTVDHPRTNRPVTVRLTRDMVAETLRYMLYVSGSARWCRRRCIRQRQATSRGSRVARLRARGAISGDGSFDGLYIAITCAEDLPGTDATREAVEAKGTFLGDYRMRQQKAACEIWGSSPVPADFYTPVRSSAPVLLVTGAHDPVTPPNYAVEVARTLPNSLNVVVPFGGHGLVGWRGYRV